MHDAEPILAFGISCAALTAIEFTENVMVHQDSQLEKVSL